MSTQSSSYPAGGDSPADLADWSGLQLLEAYARKTASPVEVTKAVIARIEACEPQLQALYAFDPEAALRDAQASEQRWMKGEARALDGIPATIKENIATKGTPVPLGTAARPLVPAAEDAPRRRGCVRMASSFSPRRPCPITGCSPRASPASIRSRAIRGTSPKIPAAARPGAGAAAAAGYGPFHIGTDIGGSIRLPAAWCGVFGLKPSFGRIPIDPTYYGRVAGPMTRTVRDAALMMTKPHAPGRCAIP